MARLKVFSAQLGFYEAVVAAPSQKAALAAWGIHQNLFADGTAHLTQDAAARQAALAQPGVVLQRSLPGGAFAASVAGDEARSDRPKPAASRIDRKARQRALTAAQAVLHKAEADFSRRESDLKERFARLEAERIELDADCEQTLGDLRRRVAEAEAKPDA